VITQHRRFYNLERPSQAVSCNNQPPSLALGTVPRLPRLPKVVDPDAWLQHYHRHSFRRLVRSNGTVTVDNDSYYVGRQYSGQRVLLMVDAAEKQFEMWHKNQRIKVRPIRKLFHGQLPLVDYVEQMVQAAQSEEKRLQSRRKLQQLVA